VERPILTLLTQRNKIKVEAPRATPPFIFPGTGEAVSGARKKDIGNTFQKFNIWNMAHFFDDLPQNV